ncbi:uncharacterized protein LOC115441781 [Manduca sexta]|uniref:uncharacterized protein LOC115441781 n=1 Tax=Manduca sexta TaxID=7130 RepID=UPI001182F158|nr:uncharacterized protein LOC115441781 [Manduca sexta]
MAIVFGVVCALLVALIHDCEAIKCFECNSANNSACLDLHVQKMNAIVPVVECGNSLPNVLSKQFFCRKITQTILYPDHTPEVRVTRSCGWIKHKRECYKADNKDHLETVCQCFGDMCNGAVILGQKVIILLVAAMFVWCWRENLCQTIA